jgi:hypothetical protein
MKTEEKAEDYNMGQSNTCLVKEEKAKDSKYNTLYPIMTSI